MQTAQNVRQTAARMAMLLIAVNSQVHRHTSRIGAIKWHLDLPPCSPGAAAV